VILDHLDRAAPYAGLNPHFPAAFAWLARTDLAALAPGEYAVTGAVKAIVSVDPGRGRQGARMECHHHTIDIQYCVRGCDEVGWRPAGELRHAATDYDAAKDTQKFFDEPLGYAPLPEGCFVILFPEDGHAPLAAEGPLLKVVLKVPAAP
jgi:YhcH/YjgK/YiaL family protein